MEVVTWTPFESFNKLQSRINGLFDENFAPSRPNAAAGKAWYPAVDILESKEAYVLRAELAGMNKEDFNLELKEGTLTLTGERKFTKPAEGVEYRSVERVSGKFVRSFTLPETVKHDGIEATYKDGILEVHIPKAEEAKPRQIQISVH
jgi:HSP20 family protein